MPSKFELSSKVWQYQGPTSWYFVTIKKEISDKINFLYKENKRGWGSLPVVVKINNTEFKTSIFTESKSKCFILPLKASVRKSENIKEGDLINFSIDISV